MELFSYFIYLELKEEFNMLKGIKISHNFDKKNLYFVVDVSATFLFDPTVRGACCALPNEREFLQVVWRGYAWSKNHALCLSQQEA